MDTNAEEEVVNLTVFLLARIAEDEARAVDAFEIIARTKDDLYSVRYDALMKTAGWEQLGTSPARVLAECAAKRQLIQRVGNPDWAGFRILALPYADHPDFDESWRD